MPRLNKLLQTDTRGKIYEEREQGVLVSVCGRDGRDTMGRGGLL